MEEKVAMTPKKIALLTDSCADLSRQLVEEYHIHVIPLRIRCRDGEYADGVDITPADVYDRLRAGELPKTSLPAGGDIERTLRQVAEEGYDGAIAIMLSSGLSGTYNLMRLAAEEVKPWRRSSVLTAGMCPSGPPRPSPGSTASNSAGTSCRI